MTTAAHHETGATGVTPGAFLADVSNAHPGWAAKYGGPEGVAQVAVALQDHVKQQASDLAAVRAAAVRELLVTHSLAEVATMLGVTKQAVSKSTRGLIWRIPTW